MWLESLAAHLYKHYIRKTLARVLRNYREVFCPTAAKDVMGLLMMVTAWEGKWKRLEKEETKEMPRIPVD